MVLDLHVANAAFRGNTDAVKAWLAADPTRVNDFATFPDTDIKYTLLAIAVTSSPAQHPNEAKLSLARWLLANGADPTIYHPGSLTPLYQAAGCAGRGGATLEMVSTLLQAAPIERQISSGMSPLRSPIVHGFSTNIDGSFDNYRPAEVVEVIRLLLRAGAPLDDYAGFEATEAAPRFSADATLRDAETKYPVLARLPPFVELRAMIDGVRACGGWTSYCRLPHKQVLRLRSLVSRGRARPWGQWKRYGYAARQDGAVTFLCKLGDNGVVWKILEFWQATR